MKNLFASLLFVCLSLNVFSQQKLYVSLLNVNDIDTSISNFNITDKSISYVEKDDNFFVLYDINYKTSTILTSVDEGTISDVYTVVKKEKNKNQTKLLVASDNGMSTIVYTKKHGKIVSMIHFKFVDNTIQGIASNTIDNL